MKRVLLIGCGAEIGASLVAMNDPQRDGFCIDTILTNPIPDDPKNPTCTGIDSLYTRIVLAQPQMLDDISVDREADALIVKGNRILVVWGDALTIDLGSVFKRKFDLCILATSKKHIADLAIIGRFLDIAHYVIGVAEAKNLPAVYANLIGVPERFLPNPPRPIGENRIFTTGSCQSNGWHAQLRALLDLVHRSQLEAFSIRKLEIDIIHPDTPTGRLGTKALEARSQDPRNNFRPSFSQIKMSMDALFPQSNNLQTVALRTLIMPPGYQISRFFFQYDRQSGRLTRDEVIQSFDTTAHILPSTLRMAHVPLGSRGFEFCEASAIVLSGEHYLYFIDNPFSLTGSFREYVSELIVQAYVHNVRGYCRSVLDVAYYLLYTSSPKAFFPAQFI